MLCKILVVDDRLKENIEGDKTSPRLEKYQNFADKFNERNPLFKLILDFAENPNDFQKKVQINHYSAAIVDAVLEEHGDWLKDKFDITKVLSILGNEIPIAMVSSHWNDTNSEEIAAAWKKPNCRTFLHWRDIQEIDDGQFGYAEIAFRSMLLDKENLDNSITLDANESIRILHISDIHSGGVDPEYSKADIAACVRKINSHWDSKSPTFIVLTGDVAEHGNPKQYKIAYGWITDLYGRLTRGKLPARNILYVPGNHDVNLCLAAAAAVKLYKNENNELAAKLEGDDAVQEELISYAYMPFRNFLNEVSDCPLLTQDFNDQSFAWIEARFRHLGVVFYGINTAQPARAIGTPGRRVSPDVLTTIADKLQAIVEDCGDNPPLIVGLGHHRPVAAGGDAAVDNPEAFENLFNREAKTALFMHGHIHEEDSAYFHNPRTDVSLVLNGAASFTKEAVDRPKDSFRGFSLLELKRENYKVKSLQVASFGWLGNDIKRTDDNYIVEYELKSNGMFNTGKTIK
ncbi:MAG: metallophosphoesterase [Methylobacter sp.]|jgi:3',5'-cyclic AMP phosphodiesterase CpdA|nr:metallophosphoesterase [Methylobacter sp.]